MRMVASMFLAILRWLNLGTVRCGWCARFLGWRRGRDFAGRTSHSICAPCADALERKLDAELAARQAVPIQEPTQPKNAAAVQTAPARRRNRKAGVRRSTLRRRIGGWSGAVAGRGYVS
jgi:hypothetical protein